MTNNPQITTLAMNDTIRSHRVFIDGVENPNLMIQNMSPGNMARSYKAFVKTKDGEWKALGNPLMWGTIGQARDSIARIVFAQRQRKTENKNG